jgi:hypothetical protein
MGSEEIVLDTERSAIVYYNTQRIINHNFRVNF